MHVLTYFIEDLGVSV